MNRVHTCPTSGFTLGPGRGLKCSASHQQVEPNIISFGAVLSACEKGQQWEGALELLERLGPLAEKAEQVLTVRFRFVGWS